MYQQPKTRPEQPLLVALSSLTEQSLLVSHLERFYARFNPAKSGQVKKPPAPHSDQTVWAERGNSVFVPRANACSFARTHIPCTHATPRAVLVRVRTSLCGKALHWRFRCSCVKRGKIVSTMRKHVERNKDPQQVLFVALDAASI